MEKLLKRKYGSDVLFLNGAVGVLIAPLRAQGLIYFNKKKSLGTK